MADTTGAGLVAVEGPPILFHFRVSHYNEKIRWALDYKQWPHRRITLVPGFHIPKVRWMTGQNKVPVLLLHGKAIHDSTAILEEIERLRPDPPLFPEDPAVRKRAMEIENWFDDEVAPRHRRLFWSSYWNRPDYAARMASDGAGALAYWTWRVSFPVLKPVFHGNLGMSRQLLDEARGSLIRDLDQLESWIGPQGYLAGDRFSVADLTAASILTALIRPPQFPYPLPEPRPPELLELRAMIQDHPGFKWVLDIYARHRSKSSELPAEAALPGAS
ncbi:MAG: hypothetical protein GMKNLPBB_02087 [Myxococcota bacterium]|nr:hypothetical protein [Myxococcota bacterium]